MATKTVTNYDDYIHEPNNQNLEGIPGDHGLPWIGHAVEYLRDPLPFLQKQHARYGEIFRLNLFGDKSVIILGPDNVQKVLIDNDQDFSSKMGFGDRVATFFEGSLIMEDFEHHKFQRRIFQTAFKNEMLKVYTDEINGIYDRSLGALESSDGQKIEFFAFIKNLLLEVAAEIFVGVKDGGDNLQKMNKAFNDCAYGLTYIFPINLPGFTYYKGLKGKEYLKEYFGSLVPEKRRNDNTDMMSLFAKETDEHGELFSDEEVTNQTIFLLFAAHDTTTSAITHTIYFLARHPEIKQKLYEECEALGKDQLDYEDLNNMPYMQMVFNEVQRARPSVPAVPRRTIRDVEMPSGVTIPAHTMVSVFPRFNHWLPEYWSHPEKFDPERFSEERKEHKQHPFLFHPFGGGAHKCIGMHFSQMEYKCFLYKFMRKFDFEGAHKKEPFMQTFPLPKPRDNMPIKLRLR